MSDTLEGLESLLQSSLGGNYTIENQVIKDLLPPGENYGSKMMSLDVTLKNHDQGTCQDLQLVAKLLPTNKEQLTILDFSMTFKKEIFMYTKLIPFYRQLEIENGVKETETLNFTPKCYGSRLGINPNNEFDSNAVLLLENLKPLGYYCIERREGCDLAHAKLAVKALANFHALGMATKEKHPEFFEELKVRGKCVAFGDPEKFKEMIARNFKEISENPETKEFRESLVDVMSINPFEAWQTPPCEPWSTIIHSDFWSNNLMFHNNSAGEPDDIKLVDFQNFLFSSPTKDLAFFVSCGLDHEANAHAHELIDLYYKTLIERLVLLKCDIQPYSRDSFDEKIREDARLEFLHGTGHLKISTMDMPKIEDSESLLHVLQTADNNEIYKSRLRDMIHMYSRNGWLKSSKKSQFSALIITTRAISFFKMTTLTLENLQSVLQSTLGSQLIVNNYEMQDLLPPGENYASRIVSLQVSVKNKERENEDLCLVGKLPPPTREQRETFDSPSTFRKEIFMYSKILPFYGQLEIDSGVKDHEIAPKYYGSKLGEHSDDFSEDAVILIENLKRKGYYCADRRYGCDLVQAKLTVKMLARFHALGMATKEKDPVFFETLKVQAKCVELANPEEWVPIISERIQDVAKDPEINKYFEACVRTLQKGNYEAWLATPDEPWSTIIHADFWANNIMYRDDNDGEVEDVKLIDFQNYLHLSPLRELTFFITCGLRHDTLDHIDELIDLYYETVIDRLKALNCDVGPYSRETFDERIREDAEIEFSHGLSMIKIITLDVEAGDPDCHNVKKLMQYGKSNEAYRRKLRDLVVTYSRRGWLGA
ncbi:uncharacterized protein LOC135173007 [Diachasmimorpha longicaudata]|uniref:uncharacterized protein LOC135173007 n=1 Tax=Diachasmimorpha longicaudata TaxID=58733 RepID=UPI0030B86938